MNKIFKSIWNHVTRTFTAVSEIQQTNGKKAKSAVVTALSASILLPLTAQTASAYSVGENVDIDSNVTIGTETPFKTESTTRFEGNNQILVPEQIGSASLSSSKLLELSSGIEEQTLIYTESLGPDISGLQDGTVSLANNLVYQTQTDANQVPVATLTFAVGSEAIRLIRANTETYSNVEGLSLDNGEIRADKVIGDKGYDNNGIAYQSHVLGWPSRQHYVWTLALLKQADIIANQTLVFDH